MSTSTANAARESIVRRPSAWDWAAAFAPIFIWIAHVSIDASLTRFTCTEPSTRWVLHAATVVTALATAGCIAWSVRGARRGVAATDVAGDAAVDDGTEAAQARFVGLLGAAIGAFNLLLILWEGSYVLFLRSCA